MGCAFNFKLVELDFELGFVYCPDLVFVSRVCALAVDEGAHVLFELCSFEAHFIFEIVFV